MSTHHPPNTSTTSERSRIVDAVLSARDAGARMVMIDGRSGSGKTELASVLAQSIHGARVLHLEDAYRGWHGLGAGLTEINDGVLIPLAEGRPGGYISWDWVEGAPGPYRRVEPLQPGEMFVVEGCGALAEPVGVHADLGIMCEAPEVLRRTRAAERDSYDWSDLWDVWARQEAELTYVRTPDIVFHT